MSKINKATRKPIKKVEAGLRFTAYDGAFAGQLFEVVGALRKDCCDIWKCKSQSNSRFFYVFQERDILAWANGSKETTND